MGHLQSTTGGIRSLRVRHKRLSRLSRPLKALASDLRGVRWRSKRTRCAVFPSKSSSRGAWRSSEARRHSDRVSTSRCCAIWPWAGAPGRRPPSATGLPGGQRRSGRRPGAAPAKAADLRGPHLRLGHRRSGRRGGPHRSRQPHDSGGRELETGRLVKPASSLALVAPCTACSVGSPESFHGKMAPAGLNLTGISVNLDRVGSNPTASTESLDRVGLNPTASIENLDRVA